MAFPPKKKKGDFALLMAEPEKKPDPLDPDADDDEDFGDMPDDPDAADDADSDPMGDDASIDPEQAALAERLGFRDPDQQQALIDLIKLVTSQDPMASTDSGSSLRPLPESTY